MDSEDSTRIEGDDSNNTVENPVENIAEAENGVQAEEPSVQPVENVEDQGNDAQSQSNSADMQWYVVNAYSGFELKAKQALEDRIRLNKLEAFFGEVKVPQETVVELVKGQKKTSNRKFFPGYLLVQMILNQDTWHLVKETSKISGFVGDATDPAPLTPEEVAKVLVQVEEGASTPRSRRSFDQGETIKVIDGPFTDFNGTIEEVKPDKGKVKVLISIFGRPTPVELDFMQIEKV